MHVKTANDDILSYYSLELEPCLSSRGPICEISLFFWELRFQKNKRVMSTKSANESSISASRSKAKTTNCCFFVGFLSGFPPVNMGLKSEINKTKVGVSALLYIVFVVFL